MGTHMPSRHSQRFIPLIVTLMIALLPSAAPAFPERGLVVGATAGVRAFEKRLDLDPDAALGFRFGLGVSRRVTAFMEYLYTAPARKTGGATASIVSLRSLVQVSLLNGRVQPYFLAGIGGVFFNFDDTADTAAGTLTGGGGLRIRISKSVALVSEASGDFYRYRSVTYDETGTPLSSTERSTDGIATFVGGVQVTF